MVAIIVFSILLLVGIGAFAMNVGRIRANILLGRDVDRTDNKSERFKTMALVALGQKKMFKRPIPAVLHLMLYAAFVITQIELIEIFADGLTGQHRMFRGSLGGFYTFMISFIEILSILAFIATFAFLARRNLLKIPRFTMKEMTGWPKLDGNLILIAEIILICFIFMMNGADEVMYQRGLSHAENLGDGSFSFAVSQWVGPALFGGMSDSSLELVERIGWWGHIVMVFSFLNYLPFSKHFHILLAFPNTYYSNLEKKGKFTNNEAVTNEVKLMMDPNADPFAAPAPAEGEVQRFGAKDVTDLTWKNLLDSYTCTECGRCTSSCPANQTGKLLSPRKIMMDTRDRLDEVGKNIRKHGKDYDDGKSLLTDYISAEELWACTSCNACVEECPVNIDPLSIITEMRRYLVMEESKAPSELATMFTNIENNGAPWQFSQADRLKWKDEN
ncbi:MAG: (Fe-S)-binding protein [Crocinitomicaceae bacterium]|nr:(Fe-S)-binding protein [Crocinitomicaceae bacterium]